MALNKLNSYHEERLNKVRKWLESEDAAFVAFDSITVRWLTGFTGSNGTIYVDEESFILFTDSRYVIQAPKELEKYSSSAECEICLDVVKSISITAKDKPILIDGERVSWAQKKKLSLSVKGSVTDSRVPIQEFRSVKDQLEIGYISKAATIAEQALNETFSDLDDATTEKEFAALLEYRMNLLGASGPAYSPIVASGENSAFPHASPTSNTISDSNLLLVDVGAVFEGYRSDMTRVMPVNPLNSKEKEALELVQEAQKLAIKEVKPGVLGKDIDLACRNYLQEKGFGDFFTHGSGHGVGLEIHEFPRINSKSKDVLKENMVITIEPGLYMPKSFGVRWEDLFLVTSKGVEFLTNPRETQKGIRLG